MSIALRHPVRYLRAFVPALREAISGPPIEITPVPAPGIVSFMQKMQFCSMGLMNGFGDTDHCYLPTEVQPGSLAIVCPRHIDEARALGIIECELI